MLFYHLLLGCLPEECSGAVGGVVSSLFEVPGLLEALWRDGMRASVCVDYVHFCVQGRGRDQVSRVFCDFLILIGRARQAFEPRVFLGIGCYEHPPVPQRNPSWATPSVHLLG